MTYLDLELLHTLTMVARYGTFAATAHRLGKTQSAVTQQMQRLEERVGQPLFKRHGRTKRLSEYGQKLVEYAKQMLRINDEALRVLSDTTNCGTLRIGAPGGIADSLLPKVLTHVARFSPGLRVEIHNGRSVQLLDELERGTLDLAVSNRSAPGLEGIVLHHSPVVWLCAADYVFRRIMPLPLILSDELSLYRKLAIDALDRHSVSWTLSYLSPGLPGVKAALRAGLGVTARNVEILGPDMRVLGEKEGLPRLPEVSYYLWRRPGTVSPLIGQVFDILRMNMGLGTVTGDMPGMLPVHRPEVREDGPATV
ncbi:LysR substrate-binding domain-containing protein [Pseudothauera rhizosphaerae]|uniref:Transcriptional regulator LrhA n=1 Tax=Pseudothauera rhizosphaerae TaxID=2565932 RepID=A0A4S4ADQ5_9RHOO|nr:LysR substrate-binding domain-containing protein [Pseudothauera rhizosphaerae]THF57203.1 transcriptional regulator LrhA [Pseudothauera rhizosphaerae]